MTANSEQAMREVWIQFAAVVGVNEASEETIKLRTRAEPTITPPPALGQDTDDVLRRTLGVSDDELAELRRTLVI